MPKDSFDTGDESRRDHAVPAAPDDDAARKYQEQVIAIRLGLKLSWPRRIFIGVFGIPLGIAQTIMAVVLLVSENGEPQATAMIALMAALALLGVFIFVYALGCLVTGLDVFRVATTSTMEGAVHRLLGRVLIGTMLVLIVLVGVIDVLWYLNPSSGTLSKADILLLLTVKWLLFVVLIGLSIYAVVRVRRSKDLLAKMSDQSDKRPEPGEKPGSRR